MTLAQKAIENDALTLGWFDLETGPCGICERDGIDPPAAGDAATGSYTWDSEEVYQFDGCVCEMHAAEWSWLSFDWK